ncbi:hypothetical protein [Ochrobactrum quorumnocens]|uniref:hypothetical protein n=1 Tax=Ochrobactrum quorumnocens TaxID=271865 RepID=UPI003BA22E1C
MQRYAVFDSDGLPRGFYSEDVHGARLLPVYADGDHQSGEVPLVDWKPNPACIIPSDAVEINDDQWKELMDFPAARRWDGQSVVEYTPPITEPEPVVIILPAVTLWERLTETEADQVNEAMATQPFRTRKIFETANTFRSDHELWPLLESMATQLFGEVRAAELLAA